MTPLPEVLPSAIATAAPGDGGGGGGPPGDNHRLDFLGEFARALGRLHYYGTAATAAVVLVNTAVLLASI